MTFEKFKQIVDLMVQNSSKVDNSNELGIDLIDFVEGYNAVIDHLWGQLLTIEGLDWFSWFLYEKNYLHDGIGDPEMKAFSKKNDDEQIEICSDLKGLYDYLKENNYFKCENQK